MKESPLYKYLCACNAGQYIEYPILTTVDSSFQDCPDTARSTGGYLIFLQGACVDHVSTMPQLIAQSSCEAEYSMGSLSTMASIYQTKIYNEFEGHDSDRPITIPIGLDSKSAIDTAKSERETQRTRHIARRYHFMRICNSTSRIIMFKLDGLYNCANSMTKPLGREQLNLEASVYEVEVDPWLFSSCGGVWENTSVRRTDPQTCTHGQEYRTQESNWVNSKEKEMLTSHPDRKIRFVWIPLTNRICRRKSTYVGRNCKGEDEEIWIFGRGTSKHSIER